MEQEKIRKRKMKEEEDHEGVVDDGNNNRKSLRSGEREIIKEDEPAMAPPPPTPSEEEVEEFFAILRRMHVAVKYFVKKDNGEERKWRAALESEEMVVMEAGEGNSDIGEEKRKIIKDGLLQSGGVLDLNSAPEESHTGVAE